MSSSRSQKKEVFWHTPVSASLGGCVGAFACFPFEGMKKRKQSGQAISFSPRELYRGATPFAVSVTIASMTQLTFNGLFKQIPGYDHQSPVWNMSSAIASGVLGATVGSTPVENIILTQQLNRTSPVGAIKIMMNQGYTRPWVGLPQLAFREAGFALTMLYGAQAAHDFALKQSGNQHMAVTAQVGAGVIGALATHPFDTVCTYRQKVDGTVKSFQASKNIYQESGIKGFYKGGANRVLLFTGCAIIIPKISNIVKNSL